MCKFTEKSSVQFDSRRAIINFSGRHRKSRVFAAQRGSVTMTHKQARACDIRGKSENAPTENDKIWRECATKQETIVLLFIFLLFVHRRRRARCSDGDPRTNECTSVSKRAHSIQ